jgi:hypothetical protein
VTLEACIPLLTVTKYGAVHLRDVLTHMTLCGRDAQRWERLGYVTGEQAPVEWRNGPRCTTCHQQWTRPASLPLSQLVTQRGLPAKPEVAR